MTDYGPLVPIACIATAIVVIGSSALRHKSIFINVLLGFCVLGACGVYSLFLQRPIWELPEILYGYVFDSTSANRTVLLIFWMINVLASIAFTVVTTMAGASSTVHRKFFHFTVSAIYLSGLFLDRDFIWLSGWLSLCIFTILECLRFHEVWPWSEHLNSYLLVFRDAQDGDILMTPIYLLMGIFLPLFLSPNDVEPRLYHTAGVAAVGVGDSLAAIIGSKLGRHKWPRYNKSMEGSLAMFISTWLFLGVIRTLFTQPVPPIWYCGMVALVLSAIEAFVKNVDNILLPLVGYFLL